MAAYKRGNLEFTYEYSFEGELDYFTFGKPPMYVSYFPEPAQPVKHTYRPESRRWFK